jgi:putative holliday junction resolvase
MNPSVYLSFDFGTHSTGVAVGDDLTCQARPLTHLVMKKGQPQWSDLDALVKQWAPDAFVVGFPLNMDGTEQTLTQKVKRFSRQLLERHPLRLYWADERLSTIEAKEQLFQNQGRKALLKEKIDAKSAAVILEQWLISSQRGKEQR